MAPPPTSKKPSKIHSNFLFFLLNVGEGGAILFIYWFYGILGAVVVLLYGTALNIVLFLDRLHENWLKIWMWLLNGERIQDQNQY